MQTDFGKLFQSQRKELYKGYMAQGERKVRTQNIPLQSCRARIGFRLSRSRSIAVAPDTICRHISKGIIFCIRERQLLSGSENVEIRYVNGSFVTETSASSPGVPRHIYNIYVNYTKTIYVTKIG